MPRLADLAALAGQGAAVCAALRDQAEKLGLSLGDEPRWAALQFVETVDSCSREIGLAGTWRSGERYGTVTFFADGRIFAEYRVLQPHPRRPGCFVEAVQIWGRAGQLRGDAVLVDAAIFLAS